MNDLERKERDRAKAHNATAISVLSACLHAYSTANYASIPFLRACDIQRAYMDALLERSSASFLGSLARRLPTRAYLKMKNVLDTARHVPGSIFHVYVRSYST